VIAERLRSRIASGEFSPGSRLPTGRELAAEYEVAPNTVLAAIRELRDDGLVTSQQGRGVYVRENASKTLRKRVSPEFQMLSSQLDAIQEALQALDKRVGELERITRPSRGKRPPR